MPPAPSSRITPLQVLALLVIWTAAILGLVNPPGRDARSVAAKAAPNVACAKAAKES